MAYERIIDYISLALAADDDVLYIVHDPSGTNDDMKITLENLRASLGYSADNNQLFRFNRTGSGIQSGYVDFESNATAIMRVGYNGPGAYGYINLPYAGVTNFDFQVAGVSKMTIYGDGRIMSRETLLAAGDGGVGTTGCVTFTNAATAKSPTGGAGTIRMAGATARENAGFLKMYYGTAVIMLPYWTLPITG